MSIHSKSHREHYLDYAQMTSWMEAIAKANPELVEMQSIGESLEGRPLWMLVIGRDRKRIRPAVWVDANMHAGEFSGTNVALAIAEDAIAFLKGDESNPIVADASNAHRRALQDLLLFVLPRMSPDGAEAMLQTGKYVRSVPRDRRSFQLHPRWLLSDVDGDGRVLNLRKEDPAGDYVELRDCANMLVPRELDDEGPFYKLYPEGTIDKFDGEAIPGAPYLSDNDVDLNRNFPADWQPEPKQYGAGPYALSEPESKAVADFVVAHPNIYSWFNLHTFGGCFIRPSGDKPDHKMHARDRSLFRVLGKKAEEITGYPMVSGFHEFLYEPSTPLHGDVVEWAYEVRGALAYVCELHDIFKQLGKEKPSRFVEYYDSLTRDDYRKLYQYDREQNEGRIFGGWTAVQHPQLGRCEVGGLDRRIGISNPPLGQLAKVCLDQSKFFFRVAALLPNLDVQATRTKLEGELEQIDVLVRNLGFLPTYGVETAKALPLAEAIYVSIDGEPVLDGNHRKIGHLEGWGTSVDASLFGSTSPGSSTEKKVSFVVRGNKEIKVTVGSSRIGFVEKLVS